MNTIKIKNVENISNVERFLTIVLSDSKQLSKLLSNANIELLCKEYGIELNSMEINTVENIKKEIVKTTNKNIMNLYEKISTITTNMFPCNGTCW